MPSPSCCPNSLAIILYDYCIAPINQKLISFGKWLDSHPKTDVICMIAAHIIRAIPMAALMIALPYAPVVNCSLAVAGSIFYYASVETRKCALVFSLPACFGGAAMVLSKDALTALISGTAFKSLLDLSTSLTGLIPLALYTVGIVYLACTSNQTKDKSSSCPCPSSTQNKH